MYECMNGILLSIVWGPGGWGEEKEEMWNRKGS